jgi:hypothetical protein
MWADERESRLMAGVLASLFLLWALLAAASHAFDVRPHLPWLPGLRLALVALPAAVGLWVTAEACDRVAPTPRAAATMAFVAGLSLLLFWRVNVLTPYIIVGFFGILTARIALVSDGLGPRLLWSTAAITAWAATIPYENYIALALSGGHFRDATFRAMDLDLFQGLLGVTDYVALFPLVREPNLLRAVENGYLSMAFIPFVVVFALYRKRDGLALPFIAGPLCYLLSAFVFALYPVFGPTCMYPESLRPEVRETLTGVLAASLHKEAFSILAGVSPVSAGSYFIGLPSMHAGLAAICQFAVRGTGALFWLLLPLNGMLVVSTVLLGHHYVADTVAGCALGWTVSTVVARWLSARRATEDRANCLVDAASVPGIQTS